MNFETDVLKLSPRQSKELEVALEALEAAMLAARVQVIQCSSELSELRITRRDSIPPPGMKAR